MTTGGELPIVVAGAGGHGKVVVDILLAAGEKVLGFVDDGKAVGALVLGLPVLGDLSWLAEHPARVALGIGDNARREEIAARIVSLGSTLVAAIHPRAVVSRSVHVGDGVVIAALAVLNPEARIERGAIVNTAAVIEHDCVVGPFAHVSPNATMAGGSSIGRLSHLGVAAAMLPCTRVGDDTVVGGGAMVTRDLPNGVVAFGIPARVQRSR